MLEFRLLGSIELVADGDVVPLPAAKPRALLTILLLHRNRVVPLDRVIDELWSDEPPETATKAAQVYVSQLRKLLGDRLERRSPGYVLRVEPGELDVDRFEGLLARADAEREHGEPAVAAETLTEALSLWRGSALAEFAEAPFARAEAARLEELRLAALERRIEIELERGRHRELVAELEQLTRSQPLRERLHEQLMLALYRSGRQADALSAYRELRARLDDELGLSPGPALRELEGAILRQDPSLEAPRALRSAAVVEPGVSRRRGFALALATGVLVATGITAGLALTNHSSQPEPSDRGLRAFVVTLENFLDQSRAGRDQIAQTILQAQKCALTPREALAELGLVERNRQSLLQQVAALSVPANDEAIQVSDRFQKAIHTSIASDWLYRRWLQQRGTCARPAPSLDAIRASDAKATAAKRAFVAVFNPLASRFSQRTWKPEEF